MRTPRPVAQAWDESGRDVTDLVDAAGRPVSRDVRARRVSGDRGGSFRRDRSRARDSGEIGGCGSWPTAGSIRPTAASTWRSARGSAVQPHGLSLEAQDRVRPMGRGVAGPGISGREEQDDSDRPAAGGGGRRRARAAAAAADQPRGLLGLAGASPTASSSRSSARRGCNPSAPSCAIGGFRRPTTRIAGGRRFRSTTGSPTSRSAGAISSATTRGSATCASCSTGVDDRYVIMNAGDELQLSFRAPAPPATGWTRDFVLVGDGWEKDGDYNTTFSKTVQPLPRHDRPDYESYPDGRARRRSGLSSPSARTGRRTTRGS